MLNIFFLIRKVIQMVTNVPLTLPLIIMYMYLSISIVLPSSQIHQSRDVIGHGSSLDKRVYLLDGQVEDILSVSEQPQVHEIITDRSKEIAKHSKQFCSRKSQVLSVLDASPGVEEDPVEENPLMDGQLAGYGLLRLSANLSLSLLHAANGV